MNLRKYFLPLLLFVLLLGSQQMGWVHALSHLGVASRSAATTTSKQKREQLPAERVCEQCLAFAQIASALDRAPFAFFADTLQPCDAPLALSRNAPVACFTAFLSRAPPEFI